MLLTIVVLILILGLLIFVHEVGHFLTAKRAGIKIEEFGFGYPPRIWGFKKGETIYSINWIPIGGFVKILGENGEEKKNPKSFSSKKISTRAFILSAGVLMNLLLAAVLLSVGFMVGIPSANYGDMDDSANFRDEKVQIVAVDQDSPATGIGLDIGDQITMIGGEEVNTLTEVQDVTKEHAGEATEITWKTGGEIHTAVVTPRENPPEGEGPLGISLLEVGLVSYPWYQAIYKGFEATGNLIVAIVVAIYDILKNIFTGQSIPADIAGPVGIAVMTGQVTRLGFIYVLQFTAILSINLAILNILPFPALDGGRLLFLIIEKVRGRPVTQKIENIVHTVGFSLLMILMVLITFRDIFRLKGKIGELWDRFVSLF